ncbi:MAG: glycosyltransferase [Actinomycetes bacterium]
MHIVHVANAYGPKSGGLRTAMHQMALGYLAAGHEVTLIVAGPVAADEQTAFGRRIMVPAPELKGSGGYRFIVRPSKVKRWLDTLQPDRLEVSDRTTLRSLGAWGRENNVPTVMWAHERVDGVLKAWLPAGIPTIALANAHNKATARAFNVIACTTAFAQEEFDRISVKNTARIPLGVDLDFFYRGNFRSEIQDRFTGGNAPLIVMCSRLSKEKKPQISIDALRELVSRGFDGHLVVAGDGPLRAELQSAAQGLPVTFLGFVADRQQMAELLASADVVLAPGPIETFGLAALESLASGTPVVVSRTSALKEVVGPQESGAGLAVAPEGIAFAGAVQDLLGQPVEDRRRAARARAEAFPWSRSVALALQLHESLGSAAGRES